MLFSEEVKGYRTGRCQAHRETHEKVWGAERASQENRRLFGEHSESVWAVLVVQADNSTEMNDRARRDFLNQVELLQWAIENSGLFWHFYTVITLTFYVFLLKSL